METNSDSCSGCQSHDSSLDSCTYEKSDSCDKSSSCSFLDSSSCDTSCNDSCESKDSCDTSCESKDTCESSCEHDSSCCTDSSCSLCPDGTVPTDGPVKCNCKYFVGAILVNEQEEEVMQILEECYCVDKSCTRYLCIDLPTSLETQLNLLNEMVCTLAEECFDPILIPLIENEQYNFTQMFINGCEHEVFYEPPIWIRFSKSNFLVYDPTFKLSLTDVPNVTRIFNCHEPQPQ